MSKNAKVNGTVEPWVGTRDVARHLGKPVSWVHDNAERLGIPRVKLSNQYRYRLSEVDAWVMRFATGVGSE
ncbi:helix-turn-helix domain-containing protein [Actinomadura rupiterrae]|uniref:helix-turn-helix domain-containing protein n=1 Tax=Actinomadura rupiterrae TaxID=559627 RepID=UPI0020A41347|nr:helix-turn-helix domain-containing protein [Actinomadura rupiterrae]MCP2335787.1 putative DNA-binding transcriptional regulator AlpA [Actinomadura rupiterrae]